MADVANDVMEIVAARMRTGDRKVRLADPLDSLGLESLDVLEITFDLEQRFDIEIPYNANTTLEFHTVGALVHAIERLIGEKAGSK
jgi:acyl carrier protein